MPRKPGQCCRNYGPFALPLDGLASLSLSSSSQTKVPIGEELTSRNPLTDLHAKEFWYQF
ncbi:hypothetical protein AMTR_s00046p00222490 [Amborella trichopoda]|uniref:Uncharacterized protein n=1 Tax=Amborella trichopoda TaxID=13333 RepID=U5CXN7_AMBTC|nr:hypothetical protein AMTR_s00046p00222490 [Amborella trichopoda]